MWWMNAQFWSEVVQNESDKPISVGKSEVPVLEILDTFSKNLNYESVKERFPQLTSREIWGAIQCAAAIGVPPNSRAPSEIEYKAFQCMTIFGIEISHTEFPSLKLEYVRPILKNAMDHLRRISN